MIWDALFLKGNETMYVFIGFTLILVVIGLFTIVYVSGKADESERTYWHRKNERKDA